MKISTERLGAISDTLRVLDHLTDGINTHDGRDLKEILRDVTSRARRALMEHTTRRPTCHHLADSEDPAPNLMPDPCPRCGLYYVNDGDRVEEPAAESLLDVGRSTEVVYAKTIRDLPEPPLDDERIDRPVNVVGEVADLHKYQRTVFCTISDKTGNVFLYLDDVHTERADFQDASVRLSVGDMIAVEGPMGRSARGRAMIIARRIRVLDVAPVAPTRLCGCGFSAPRFEACPRCSTPGLEPGS